MASFSSQYASALQKTKDDASDFAAWTALLALAEKDEATIAMRQESFDGFLSLYPLCYGYWIKFAKLMHASGDYAASEKIYIRGCEAVRESVDMWLGYCSAVVAWEQEPGKRSREAFEKAVSAVGRHPDGGSLWQAYAASERDTAARTAVYERAVRQPLKNSDVIWSEFEKLAAPQVVEDAMAARKPVLEAAAARQHFESAVSSRPYFHVTPVPEDIKEAWSSYLDFEAQSGSSLETVEFLFKRCLIVCANYPEFWIKYASWCEERGEDDDAAENVFSLATSIFVKDKPSVWFAYAEHMEARGKIEDSRSVFERIEKIRSGLVETAVRRAHFERRQGRAAEAEDILKSAAAAANEDAPKAFCIVHLARIRKCMGASNEVVRKTYADAGVSNAHLSISFADFELASGKGGVDRARAIFQAALGSDSKLSDKEKTDIFHLYIEMEESMGTSIRGVRKAKEQYRNWLSSSRKRSAAPGGIAPNAKRARAAAHNGHHTMHAR